MNRPRSHGDVVVVDFAGFHVFFQYEIAQRMSENNVLSCFLMLHTLQYSSSEGK